MPNPTRITDLDLFALEHIWSPYKQSLSRRNQLRITDGKLPHDLDTTLQILIDEPEWAHKVLKRISEIGFEFPEYIKHPLVDYIKNAVKQIQKPSLPPCLSNGTATPQQQKYAAEHIRYMNDKIIKLEADIIDIKMLHNYYYKAICS